MLIQQLRDLERDGIVARTVYPQVPPKSGVPPHTVG
ncbi:MAG: winged helix-turn-helix transcriptional regulator [Rhodospirillaceae bacterium]